MNKTRRQFSAQDQEHETVDNTMSNGNSRSEMRQLYCFALTPNRQLYTNTNSAPAETVMKYNMWCSIRRACWFVTSGFRVSMTTSRFIRFTLCVPVSVCCAQAQPPAALFHICIYICIVNMCILKSSPLTMSIEISDVCGGRAQHNPPTKYLLSSSRALLASDRFGG